MNIISLNDNQIALVSNEDFEAVMQYRWRYSPTTGYAIHHYKELTQKKIMFLHRFVYIALSGAKIPKGYIIDHLNGNRLDAQRHNLRLATPNQNAWNSSKPANSLSLYKGVVARNDKYEAHIRYYYQRIYIGRFETAEDAALAYDAAARLLFKEFAKPNFHDAITPAAVLDKVHFALKDKGIAF